MPDPRDSGEQRLTEEYNDDDLIPPRHDPHRASRLLAGTCKRFPNTWYLGKDGYCGTDNLEVDGLYGFKHVRCPFASPTPCSCGRYSLHIDSLVVAVDGACPGNGTDRATKSACGIFFGHDSPANYAFCVPDNSKYPHTSQRAELTAAMVAIMHSHEYFKDGGQWDCTKCPTPCTVKHLVIKSDSAYLVDGMTEHLANWRKNGWRTAQGTEVKNRELWELLDGLVRTYYDETRVSIDFWHVPRHQNSDADRLANEGLRNGIPLQVC
ncbi:hypothetical protein ONZ43_g2065 [Nemania bipapillata]|uniref:Uncharacterized protein n=1 Tax=Nemania bipapillata TaxID=110536 RepID=A0ACC2J208_9PEZI|nr:hypothetical protein ONZ43_g2065 [Nemania bipapillata]